MIHYPSGLEDHPGGSLDLNAIIDGNWKTLNSAFNPALGLTASQASTTVTSDTAIFTSDDVGAYIQFADGTTRIIASYTSAIEVEVTVSGTVASQSFELYRTDNTQRAALMRALTKQVRMLAGDDGKLFRWSSTYERLEAVSALTCRSLSPTPGATVAIVVNNLTEQTLASWTASQDETLNISGTHAAGQVLLLKITCDGTSRQITLGTGFSHTAGSGGLVFKIAASAVVFLRFVSDGTNFIEDDGRELRGTIKLWSGTIASIPTGWVLCDGNNGSPDLTDKFVIGAKQDDSGTPKTNVTGSLTSTGGAATHSHTNPDTGSATDTLAAGTDIADASGAGAFSTTTSGHTHTQADTGSSSSLPPYLALAYLFKL